MYVAATSTIYFAASTDPLRRFQQLC